jgi:uncharacterized protein (TIGR02117 family)
VVAVTEVKVKRGTVLKYPKMLAAALILVVAGCATVRGPEMHIASTADTSPRVVVYVIKRSWHTDIGFTATDLHPPLASLRARLPAARYLLFGFGDRHYLMNHGSSANGLLGAILPGAGVVLVTGLTATPEESFGATEVIRLRLSAAQATALENFVWSTLAAAAGAHELGAGPYDGSLYYAATLRYSGVHTCNTWTAEALRAAGLPVHSAGVEFSGQVWHQVRKLTQLQGGRVPS